MAGYSSKEGVLEKSGGTSFQNKEPSKNKGTVAARIPAHGVGGLMPKSLRVSVAAREMGTTYSVYMCSSNVGEGTGGRSRII